MVFTYSSICWSGHVDRLMRCVVTIQYELHRIARVSIVFAKHHRRVFSEISTEMPRVLLDEIRYGTHSVRLNSAPSCKGNQARLGGLGRETNSCGWA